MESLEILGSGPSENSSKVTLTKPTFDKEWWPETTIY